MPIDAPRPSAKAGGFRDQIRGDELLVPLVVVDVSRRADADPDAILTIEDVAAWERQHGRIPSGACIMIYSGWERQGADPARYIGLDANPTGHFPCLALEAARFLIEERQIWGVGVDTIPSDPGHDHDDSTHELALGAGKFALEAVANLDKVPPTGATLIICSTKVQGTTQDPVRLIAVW